MLDRRRVQAMLLQQQQQQLLQQQQPGYSSVSAGLLPNYGSSGALRASGSAGSGGKKAPRLPSPAGVVGSTSSSALGGLPMELPALPATAEDAEPSAGGTGNVGAGGAAAVAKHRRTHSLLAAAGKRVSAPANAAASGGAKLQWTCLGGGSNSNADFVLVQTSAAVIPSRLTSLLTVAGSPFKGLDTDW
jgi:hypothetical protein